MELPFSAQGKASKESFTQLFGSACLLNIKNFPVLCIGTTYGPAEAQGTNLL